MKGRGGQKRGEGCWRFGASISDGLPVEAKMELDDKNQHFDVDHRSIQCI